MSSYKVEGLKQLEKALELLGDRATKKVLKGALRDASRPVIKEMRSRLPKRTGRLRKTIGAHIDKYGNMQIGYRVSKKYWGFVGRLLEQGTKAHTITLKKKDIRRGRKAITTPYGAKRSVNVRGIRANPVLDPALRSKEKQAIEAFKKRAYERLIIETINKSKAFK